MIAPLISDLNVDGDTLLLILVVVAIIALIIWILNMKPWVR